MLDSNMKVTVTHDISLNVTQSSSAVALGRVGLPEGATLVVVVESSDTSSANFPNPVRVYFEYTTDGGTTWRRGGSVELQAGSSGLPAQVRAAPVGFADIVPERHASDDIQWRVTSDIGATIASSDDFTYTAYLAGRGSAGAVID